MYSTSDERFPANYSGDASSGYCEVTGLDYQSTFSIVFRISDHAGNIGYSET
jgi:hypothetical protein